MGCLGIFPLTPSIARYTFFPFWFLEFMYLIARNSKAVVFCQAPFIITALRVLYTEYKGPTVQTKNEILFSLCGITVGSFLWNIGLLMVENETYKYLLLLTVIYIQTFCHYSLVYVEVRLGMDPSKLIINPCHMFLITFFFCISAQWIYPYARWYNWILHFYTFLLAIETSITTTTQEFIPGEFPEQISHLPSKIRNRTPREPWKQWKYL